MPAETSGSGLFVVIPVHNRREQTRGCLQRLGRQTRRDFRVIVVDDGSSDGTSEMIRSDYPDVQVLAGDGTLWWTAATNLGVKCALESGAGSVLCLNNDTQPALDLIERLLQTSAVHPDALIGASAVDTVTGRPCFTGERVRWWTAGAHSMLNDRKCSLERTIEVSHAPGRGLLIPARVFLDIGLFDARHFPQAAADYDFTHRARRAGYGIICDRGAVLSFDSANSGGAAYYRKKGCANYARHLFTRKGDGNLRTFFWYAVRNCPLILLPVCLIAGLLRRVCGYPLHCTQERWMSSRRGHDRATA